MTPRRFLVTLLALAVLVAAVLALGTCCLGDAWRAA